VESFPKGQIKRGEIEKDIYNYNNKLDIYIDIIIYSIYYEDMVIHVLLYAVRNLHMMMMNDDIN
jgi:hypothetical protein